ncbi:MAG: ABC transporter permease [Acidobacteriota bacterium]
MYRYIAKRVGIAAVTLLGITFIVFVIIHLAPGSPLEALSDEGTVRTLPPEAYEQMKKIYHMQRPLLEQYLFWLNDLIHLDLGESFSDHRRVSEKILERLPNTIVLNLFAILIMFIIAIPVGALSASRQNSRFDRASGVISSMLYSLPNFWVAISLQLIFAVYLKVLPLYGIESEGAESFGIIHWITDRAVHLLLPAICLSYAGLAFLSRFSRAGLVEVIRQDYIRTARAKGLDEKVITFKHGLRNSLIPMITLFGLMLPSLIGGSIIIEQIFAWPGIGRLFFEAVFQRDYPTVMGLSLISAVLTLLGTLVADLLYTIADPRVRYE